MSSIFLWIFIPIFISAIAAFVYGMKSSSWIQGGEESILLQRKCQLAIEDRFGKKIINKKTSFDNQKCYVILRCNTDCAIKSRSGLVAWHTDVLLQDQDMRFWHVIAYVDYKTNSLDFYVASFDAFRMRRALFNDPINYQLAFGEQPNRDQLIEKL